MTFPNHVEAIVDVSNLPLDNITIKNKKKLLIVLLLKMPPFLVNSTSSRESVACPHTIATLLKPTDLE